MKASSNYSLSQRLSSDECLGREVSDVCYFLEETSTVIASLRKLTLAGCIDIWETKVGFSLCRAINKLIIIVIPLYRYLDTTGRRSQLSSLL
jgi:hypothetical protein